MCCAYTTDNSIPEAVQHNLDMCTELLCLAINAFCDVSVEYLAQLSWCLLLLFQPTVVYIEQSLI